MIRKSCVIGVAVLFSCLGADALAASWKLPASRLQTPPKIDGVISAGEWDAAAVVSGFVTLANTPAARDTTVKVGFTQDGLYVLYICDYDDPSQVRAGSRERDTNLWSDDIVELFLDPGRTRKDYYHFVVNAGGTKLDELSGDPNWTSSWDAAVGKTDSAWIAEMFIPFAALNLRGGSGQVWGINFCRNDQSGGGASQWKHTGGTFHRPDMFGQIGPVELDATRFSARAEIELPEVIWPGENAVPVQINAKGQSPSSLVLQVNVYDSAYQPIGSHRAQVSGTGDKLQARVAATFPETGRYFLEPVLTRAREGTLLHSGAFVPVTVIDEPMVRFSGDHETGIVFPNQRNTPVHIRVLIPPMSGTAAADKTTVALRAIQSSGRVWQTWPQQAVTGRALETDLDVTDWPGGSYRIEAIVQSGASRSIGSRVLEIVPKWVEHYVYVDRHGRTIVRQDGKRERAVFPIGIFSAPAKAFTPEIMQTLSAAGINALQDYSFYFATQAQRRAYLDTAHANGMFVILPLKERAMPFKPQVMPDTLRMPAAELEAAAAEVLNYRHHPAVLGWYIADEPEIQLNKVKPPKLRELYHFVKALDPYRPTMAAFCQAHGVTSFYDGYDIAMPDQYPFPENVEQSYGLINWYFGDVRDRLDGRKPFWGVIQAYDKKRYNTSLTGFERTYPVYEEIRLMAFQALTHGSRGLWFYEWSGLADPQYKPMFDGLLRVTREVSALSPILLSTNREFASIEAQGHTRGIWLEHEGAWYLLLSNGGKQQATVDVKLPEAIKARSAALRVNDVVEGKETSAESDAKIAGAKIRVTLEPIGARVLKVSGR